MTAIKIIPGSDVTGKEVQLAHCASAFSSLSLNQIARSQIAHEGGGAEGPWHTLTALADIVYQGAKASRGNFHAVADFVGETFTGHVAVFGRGEECA